jgi:hypothetical protein
MKGCSIRRRNQSDASGLRGLPRFAYEPRGYG